MDSDTPSLCFSRPSVAMILFVYMCKVIHCFSKGKKVNNLFHGPIHQCSKIKWEPSPSNVMCLICRGPNKVHDFTDDTFISLMTTFNFYSNETEVSAWGSNWKQIKIAYSARFNILDGWYPVWLTWVCLTRPQQDNQTSISFQIIQLIEIGVWFALMMS